MTSSKRSTPNDQTSDLMEKRELSNTSKALHRIGNRESVEWKALKIIFLNPKIFVFKLKMFFHFSLIPFQPPTIVAAVDSLQLGQTEVGNLDEVVGVDEDVGGFEVSVDETLCLYKHHAVNDLNCCCCEVMTER